MTAGLTLAAPPDPSRRCGSTARWPPGGFATWPRSPPALLDASGVVPVNAAARARPSERTIRFYVARGLVSPPDGRGTAAVVLLPPPAAGPGHQAAADGGRHARGADPRVRRADRRPHRAPRAPARSAPALPRPDRLALLQAPGTGRGRVGRAVLGWLTPVEGGARRGHGVPADRRGAGHRGADRRAASGAPAQRRHRRASPRPPPGARRPGRLLDFLPPRVTPCPRSSCWSFSWSSCSG